MSITSTGLRQGTAKMQKSSERCKSGTGAEQERIGCANEIKMKAK